MTEHEVLKAKIDYWKGYLRYRRLLYRHKRLLKPIKARYNRIRKNIEAWEDELSE